MIAVSKVCVRSFGIRHTYLAGLSLQFALVVPSPGVPACFTALIALRVAQPIRSARTPFFVLAHVVQSQDEATKAAARFDAIALGVARDLGGEDQLSTVQKQLVEAFAGIALDDHGDCIGCGGRCRLRSNRGRPQGEMSINPMQKAYSKR